MVAKEGLRFNRRELLKYGGAALAGSAAASLVNPASVEGGGSTTCLFKADESQVTQSPCSGQRVVIEYLPTSPFILGLTDPTTGRRTPFIDPLPVPAPFAPVTQAVYDSWKARGTEPGPALGRQASDHDPLSTHSLWPSDIKFKDGSTLPEPVIYYVPLQLGTHSFTSSKVQPIDALGANVS